MGAGKSTRARHVADSDNYVLISEDEWLSSHYPDQINSFEDYLFYSKRIKPFLKQHIQRLLTSGQTVVMDFPANTVSQRKWLVSISSEVGSTHALNYLNVADDVCLANIAKRRIESPQRAQFDTEEVFREVNNMFQVPSEHEGLNIVEIE